MDYALIFKIIGATGLLLISFGILNKEREKQDLFYIMGGICLEVYSLYLHDLIFIILQIVFTISAVYDLIQVKKKLVVKWVVGSFLKLWGVLMALKSKVELKLT